MKVLFCTNCLDNTTNGPAKFAQLLLKMNGHEENFEIKILTEDTSKPTKDVFPIRVKYPRFLSILSQFYRINQYHKKALKIREDYPFDIIVYNNSFLGLKSAKHPGMKSIGMINDYNNIEPQSFSFSKKWIKNFLWRRLERNSAKRHDKIIVNSEFLKKYVKAAYSLDGSRLELLYKAAAHENIETREYSEIASVVKIMFVKTDFRLGGLFVLFDAIKTLTHYNFEVTIIGPQKEHWTVIRNALEGASHIQLNLLGSQPNSVVSKKLLENDIFCVPSYREALGVANIEAMLAGVSVISSDAGGIPEVLNDGNAGWISKKGDSSSLKECILNCIENEEERKTKITYAKEYAKRNFSVDNMYKNFTQILRTV